MKITCALGFRLVALLLQLAIASGVGLAPTASAQTAAALAAEMSVAAPIDLSPDGELLLLFLPGGRGFELVNTQTGARDIVSDTPNTGYFATLSPDKQYVCFKEFQVVGGDRLQVPVLYEIAGKKQVLLDKPARAVGNPVASARGQIAYTMGTELVVLNADLSRFMAADLGAVVNVLAFSPDGGRLAFSDPSETFSWIELKTGTRSVLPAAGAHGYQPRFSPDGQAVLARSSNGEVTAVQLATGFARSFGRAHAAAWVDADTVALVRKTVANYAVSQTEVVKRKLSDGSTATVLTRQGNVEVAMNAPAMVLAAPEGVSLADPQTGASQTLALAARPPPAVAQSGLTTTASDVTPRNVVTNGAIVQLVGVPYVHQVYDTANSFTAGYSCCNATAGLMAIQYYQRLPSHPITCSARSSSHTSNYGFYISSIYSYNGVVFNVPSSATWGTDCTGWYGGFGYFLQDNVSDSLAHSTRLSQWIAGHGLTAGTDDSVSYAKAKAEVDANHPVVLLNSLTTAGHYITCIGYVAGQYTLIFNDPYGNKNVSYPSANGAGAYYDWPGYNNGYQNLNSAWRYN